MSVKELEASRVDVRPILRLADLLMVKRGVRTDQLGAKPEGGIREWQLTCRGGTLDRGDPELGPLQLDLASAHQVPAPTGVE